MAVKKILIIEDEPHLAEGLELNLTMEGHKVSIAKDGKEALDLWTSFSPDLIILDLMIPLISGEEVLQNIRLKDERIPILVLSAKGLPKDKVNLLNLGADDFLTKPFHLEELLLRVTGALKRGEWYRHEDEFHFGNNHIDFARAKGIGIREEIQLTAQELKLLRVFIQNQNVVITRQDLLKKAWGHSEQMETRTLDNFIVRFRKYFEPNPKEPIYFKNIRSMGYLFSPEGKSV